MAGFNMKELLSDKSKGEAKTGKPAFEIRQIPIGKLVPSDKNHYTVADIEELAVNIEEVGLLHNLVVREADENGDFEIISGERRFRACKMLHEGGNTQFAELPCKVELGGDGLLDELRLIYANSTARELSDYDKMAQAIRIKEILTQLKKSGHKFKGRMRDNVADAVGVSSSQMGKYESIHKHLDPGKMEDFREGKIGVTEAWELSKQSGVGEEVKPRDAGGDELAEAAKSKNIEKADAGGAAEKQENAEKPKNEKMERGKVAILLREIAEEIEAGKTASEHDAKHILRWAASILGVKL